MSATSHGKQGQASSTTASAISPDEAMKKLKEGNTRYASGSLMHPNQDQARRSATVPGQQPFASILACSDSRVPVEIIFDSGIGDIFVIRVAGNVADVGETASIEYGVDHLATPILVILGHSCCGAVTAVVQKAELHGSIPRLAALIEPAVAKARAMRPEPAGDALILEATKINMWMVIEDLFRKSEAVRKRVKAGGLKVVGAFYDIESGKVDWMGSHPEQEKLIAV
ncbi:MAG: carbonic anhydrase [Syntrophobacteraceae bacterium]